MSNPCTRCGGAKIIDQYVPINGGVCFRCDGSGEEPEKEAPSTKFPKRRHARPQAITLELLMAKYHPEAEVTQRLRDAWLEAEKAIDNVLCFPRPPSFWQAAKSLMLVGRTPALYLLDRLPRDLRTKVIEAGRDIKSKAKKS